MHLTSIRSIRRGSSSPIRETEEDFEEKEQRLVQFVKETTRQEERRNAVIKREKTRLEKLIRFRVSSDILRRSQSIRREGTSPRRREFKNARNCAIDWLKYECFGDQKHLKDALESVENEDVSRLEIAFCVSDHNRLHESILKGWSTKLKTKSHQQQQKDQTSPVVLEHVSSSAEKKKNQNQNQNQNQKKRTPTRNNNNVEKKKDEEQQFQTNNSVEKTSPLLLQILHLENQSQDEPVHDSTIPSTIETMQVQQQQLKKKSTRKKMSGRHNKWNPPKNVNSLVQLFRVKKLIDPENIQCESFPTSEESNLNLINMLYRQSQSDQEKCERFVKTELKETILRDMPKQILDEYKMSEDIETEENNRKKMRKNIDKDEKSNDNGDEKKHNKEEEEKEDEEIDVIDREEARWHARTFPYPRPVNFELGVQEFLKIGKRTNIPGGYLSGSEKSQRARGFKHFVRYQKLRLAKERREKMYAEQKRKEEEAIRKEKERIKSMAKRKSQVDMLNLHGASLRMVGKFGSIVGSMKSETLNEAGKMAKTIIGRLGEEQAVV